MIDWVSLGLIVAGLIAMNIFAFAAFGIDKIKAETGQWRVRESTLLMLALLGGSPGAYAGRALFRHKTRKQPFSNILFSIVVIQVIVVSAATGWILAGWLMPET